MKTQKIMAKSLFFCCAIFLSTAHAGGGYDLPVATASANLSIAPQYVCFDGRRLNCTPAGFAWKAKRGCYLSIEPCNTQQAGLYGYFPNSQKLMEALRRCQENYPFRLGEIQVI